MPSGSHGGSAGSHSSGGSSGGGGGSHWGGSRGGRSYPSRPSRIRFRGNVYVIRGGAFNTFLALAIFTAFFMLMSIAGIYGENHEIKKIKTDYNYYQAMIVAAENDPNNLIVNGVVTDCFENEACDKWYIIYEIRKNGIVLEGYSYSIYTMEEAQNLLRQTIKIAVNSDVITYKTDSIPLDYKNTTLSDDGEYVNAKKGVRNFVIMTIIGGLGTLTLIAFGIRKIIKNAELETTSPTPSSTNSTTNTQPAQFWICEYCGNSNLNSKTKCTQCGAKK